MIRHWWQAGEEHAVMKYQKQNGSDVLFCLFLIAVLWLILGPNYVGLKAALALMIFAEVVLERRIAILFTNSEVIYRPMLRTPRRIRFEHVVEIRKATVHRRSLGAFVGFEPGVVLRILGGEVLTWPLPFARSDEILQQLARLTGRPIR